MKDKISLQAHWFDKCKKFSEDQLKDIYYYVIRYWLYEEEIDEIDDPAIDVAFGFIKDQIDLMESRAERKNEDFHRANEARHKMGNAEKVKELLEENPNYSSKQIAALLGISDGTVRGYDVWKQRKMLFQRLESVEKNVGSTQEVLKSTQETVEKNVGTTQESTAKKQPEYDF